MAMCANIGSLFPGGWLALTVLILGLAAALVLARLFFAPRRTDFRRSAAADREDALRLLRLRLADGSITEDEFERLRQAVDPPATSGNR
ncbi:SHOCT domain-containing protein [Solidesulfovibrio sp.]